MSVLHSLSSEVLCCESFAFSPPKAGLITRYRSPVGLALSALVWVVYTSAIQLEGYVAPKSPYIQADIQSIHRHDLLCGPQEIVSRFPRQEINPNLFRQHHSPKIIPKPSQIRGRVRSPYCQHHRTRIICRSSRSRTFCRGSREYYYAKEGT
jgi:hypothetical protein